MKFCINTILIFFLAAASFYLLCYFGKQILHMMFRSYYEALKSYAMPVAVFSIVVLRNLQTLKAPCHL